jgi:hypothetical protein
MPPNTGPVGIGIGIRLNHHNIISHFFKLLLTKGGLSHLIAQELASVSVAPGE